MSTRPETPLAKSRWSSTTATRMISSSPLLKSITPLSSPRASIAFTVPDCRRGVLGHTGGDRQSAPIPYSILHAGGIFVGDFHYPLLGNLDRVIRPGSRDSLVPRRPPLGPPEH